MYKLVQKQTYTFLSHRHGMVLIFIGLIIVIISAIHFGESSLEWSRDQYSQLFNIYHDNIAGKAFQNRMCLPIPIDAVYTWVNGSDPKLIADLQHVKEKLEKVTIKEPAEDENKLIQCKDDNCIPGRMIVFGAELPGSLDKEDLARSHIGFLQEDRVFNLTKSGRKNITVAQFEKQSVVDIIMKEKAFIFYKGRNVSLSRGYLTSDWQAEDVVELKDVVFVSNVGKNVTEDQLRGKIPEEQRENVKRIDLTSSAGVAVITLKTGDVTQTFITEFEKSEGEEGMKVGSAYLLWGLEQDKPDHEEDVSKSRFEDNEEMRYSLRSLEQNAPWIRHVYIVTNGQIPSWLNLDNPRITLVTHGDIFPNSSHLPTFSSPAIESNLHRIPGLSEKFIYLNDDTMFGVPVWPDDFYTHSRGQKIYLTWPVPNCAEGCPPSWIRDNYCDMACNNSECDWDGGDCAGVTKAGPVGGGIVGDNARDTPDLYCNIGCANAWIADRYCDQPCNIGKCGFDAGDCGVDNFNHLYGVDIKGPVNITIPKGVTVFFLNLTAVFGANSSITEAQYDDDKIVRTATVAQKYKLITVLLHENITSTLISVNVSGLKMDGTQLNVAFNLTVNSIPIPERALTVVKQTDEKANKTDQDEMAKVPFADIPEHERGPKIQANANPSVELPAIDTESLSNEIALKLAELDKKQSDGDITKKGLKKLKAQLLQEYLQSPEYASKRAKLVAAGKQIADDQIVGDSPKLLQDANGKLLRNPETRKTAGDDVGDSMDEFKKMKFRQAGYKQQDMQQQKPHMQQQQQDVQQQPPHMQQQQQDMQLQKPNVQQQQPLVQQQQPRVQQQQPLVQQQQPLVQQQKPLVQQQKPLVQQQQPLVQQQQPLVQQQQPPVQQQKPPVHQQQPLVHQQQPLVQQQQPPVQQQQPHVQQQKPPVQQQQQLVQQQQPPVQQQKPPVQQQQQLVQQQQPPVQQQQPPVQQQQQLVQQQQPPVQQQKPLVQQQQPPVQQQELLVQQQQPLVHQQQPLVQQQKPPVQQQQQLVQQQQPPVQQQKPLVQQQQPPVQQQELLVQQQQPLLHQQQQLVQQQQPPVQQQKPLVQQQQPPVQQQELLVQQQQPLVHQQQPLVQQQKPPMQQQKPLVQQQQPPVQKQPSLQQQDNLKQQPLQPQIQLQPLFQQQQQKRDQQQQLFPEKQHQPVQQQQQQQLNIQHPKIFQQQLPVQQQERVNAQQPQRNEQQQLNQQPPLFQQQQVDQQQPLFQPQKQQVDLHKLQKEQPHAPQKDDKIAVDLSKNKKIPADLSRNSKFAGAGGKVQQKQPSMNNPHNPGNSRKAPNQDTDRNQLGGKINPQRPANIHELEPVLFNRKPPRGQVEQLGPQKWREPVLINRQPVAPNLGNHGNPVNRQFDDQNRLPNPHDRFNQLGANRPEQGLPNEKVWLPDNIPKQDDSVKQQIQQDTNKKTGLNRPGLDLAGLDRQEQPNAGLNQPQLVPKNEKQKGIIDEELPRKKFHKGKRKETGRKLVDENNDMNPAPFRRKLLSDENFHSVAERPHSNSSYLDSTQSSSLLFAHSKSNAFTNARVELPDNRGRHGIHQKHPGKYFAKMRIKVEGDDSKYKKSDTKNDEGVSPKRREEDAVAMVMDDVTDEEAEKLAEDAEKFMRKMSFLPWERKTVPEEKESKSDYRTTSYRSRRTLDTFADSLIHVNRIFNKRFGFISRKVPGHIPHMIDVNIMKELQAKFPAEFDETSSHQIRHSRDMQFAFSYMYYIIGFPKEVNTNEIFDEFDTDHSGVLSDREIRTLATRLFELPLDLQTLSSLENNFIQCAKNLSKAVYEDPRLMQEKYYEEKMPQVTKAVVAKCTAVTDLMQKSVKGQTNYKYEILGDEDISFKMIRTNVSQVIGQLDDIRKNPKKFVCLNDNIDHTNPDAYMVKAVLQDFYEALFPIISQFELPREYRNRFLHVDELREWRRYRDWLRFWTQISLFALIAFSVASFCSRQLMALRRRCCPRHRTKMGEIAEHVQHV